MRADGVIKPLSIGGALSEVGAWPATTLRSLPKAGLEPMYLRALGWRSPQKRLVELLG